MTTKRVALFGAAIATIILVIIFVGGIIEAQSEDSTITTTDAEASPANPCGDILGTSICNIVTEGDADNCTSPEIDYRVEVYEMAVFAAGTQQGEQVQVFNACFAPSLAPDSNCATTCQ